MKYNQNTIPKRIFYVWGANEPLKTEVSKCILSWKETLPDYEIIEINEDGIEYFNFKKELENNLWFKTIYERKMYAYVADYIRIKVLYENGGIYLDTDVTVLKSFDEFLFDPAFVALQSDGIIHRDLFEPAILGAQKGNPILKQILDFYQKDIWETDIYRMPQIFTHFIEKNYGPYPCALKSEQQIQKFEDITIYPERFFIPYRWSESFTFDCIENDTHSIHWFGGSWIKDEILFFLENKHKIPLVKIDKEFAKFKERKIRRIKIKTFLEMLFSLKNSREHKIICVLGIKLKLKRKRKIQK